MSKERGLRAFHNARLRKQQKKALHKVDGKFAQAVTLHQRGFISGAQALYREILQDAPNDFDALYFLGVSEFQAGRHGQADHLIQQALAVKPQSAEAHSTRGAILYELRRYEEALTNCERALALNSDDADTFNIRGNALVGLGRLEEAVASYDKAITLKPNFAGARNNRGNALRELMRFDEALASYDKALAILPDFADAFNNRGNALKALVRYDEALASFDKALAIKPDYAEAFSNRGIALLELNRLDEALASFDKALAIKPALVGALNSRGNTLKEMMRFDEALASFDRAIAIKPDYVEALSNRGIALTELMRFDEALENFDKAIAIKPDSTAGISNKIFYLDFSLSTGFEKQQNARKDWWQKVGSKIAAGSHLRHDNICDPARRLVLGYVSSDFRQHSAATTIKPVLQNQDKTQFQIICYACSVIEDDVTKEFQRIADIWRNVAHFSDERLAEQIQKDQVDILIDLSGHSAGNRLGVFARAPAPIQVTAWGHAAGTGLPTIDYLFSDPVAIPAAARHHFSERIYDLPCLVTTERPRDELRSAYPPVLVNKYTTFGVFNRISKISHEAIGVWAKILHAVPRSRLLIKDVALDSEMVANRLKENFVKHGSAADRIGLLGRTTRDEHLAAYKDVDICLDPFPVGGGVSTWEALHMGVPVVSILGDGVSARLASAILSSIGLQGWVADNVDGYSAIAMRFASQPEALSLLRRELPTLIATSVAGNSVAYTKAVEVAYRIMWEDYCRRKSR